MKTKYFVVWNGRQNGIFNSWEECKKQVDKFPKAKYKGFTSKKEAEEAFVSGYENCIKKSILSENSEKKLFVLNAVQPIVQSVCVDAACSGNPGDMEYRGVNMENGNQIFHQGPFKEGTNNIGEFLAIVHGLALLKQKNSNLPIYSDSKIAISWVKNKKCRTNLDKTENNAKLFEIIERAEKWLNSNDEHNEVLKWHTTVWGEIPADFGRK
ncbi:MAG: ribonuclease H family protein [Prevotellaceae bacterium]|jgi:ribonuclease HI|nr:ribonuclease H family protein [Prevotellaceae bacterium]